MLNNNQERGKLSGHRDGFYGEHLGSRRAGFSDSLVLLEGAHHGERKVLKNFSVVMRVLLLLSVIILAFNVQPAKRDAQTIYSSSNNNTVAGNSPSVNSDFGIDSPHGVTSDAGSGRMPYVD
jgi:hypothetical protein